ncbi:hypothetical protein Emed_000709 [Eimeria media]
MNLLLLLLLLQCAELCAAYRVPVHVGQGSSSVLSTGPRCGFSASPAAACGRASPIRSRWLHACSSSLPTRLRSLPPAAASIHTPELADCSVEWELGTLGDSAEALSPAAQPAADAAAQGFFSADEKDSSLRSGMSSSSRMRLTLTLSNNHVYACITDKSRQHTFAFASSMDKLNDDSATLAAACQLVLVWLWLVAECRLVGRPHGGTMAAAAAVGALVAARGLKAGISKVFFDRKSYRYGGRVAALADAARKAGLDF